MEEQWLYYIIDGCTILVGASLSLYAIIRLVIELRVKDQEGKISYSGLKVSKQLLLFFIGVALIAMRVHYMVERNSWYNF